MIALLALTAGLILGAFTTWFASAMRELGPQPVTTPRLTPLTLRAAPLLEYEELEVSRAMQARARWQQAAWDNLWPQERPCPAGSFAAAAS